MRLAIMQPYLFPYIGYFQLINAVDTFVVYDNIEYAKKGWINRNRILLNGKGVYITLPLKKDSDYLNINERYLADTWLSDRKKILNRVQEAYKKAPFFDSAFPVVEKSVMCDESNLFDFIFNSLNLVKEYLEIQTPFVVSSTISIDHTTKSEKKVIAICEAKECKDYINPIGGIELYDKDEFTKEGINLHFIKSDNIIYKQFNNEFVSSLSIIDVMMFNPMGEIKKYLNLYKLV